ARETLQAYGEEMKQVPVQPTRKAHRAVGKTVKLFERHPAVREVAGNDAAARCAKVDGGECWALSQGGRSPRGARARCPGGCRRRAPSQPSQRSLTAVRCMAACASWKESVSK